MKPKRKRRTSVQMAMEGLGEAGAFRMPPPRSPASNAARCKLLAMMTIWAAHSNQCPLYRMHTSRRDGGG